MDLITALLTLLLLLALLFLRRSYSAHRRPLPPGPPRWRVLLDLFRVHHNFLRFQRFVPFGEVASSYFWTIPMVVLNSHRAVYEAFVTQAEVFSARPRTPYIQTINRDSGIIFTDGPVWREHRRLALRLLRDFGVGRSGAEAIVADECGAIRETLEAVGPSRGVDCRQLFTSAINNVIARLTFGERCGSEDPQFESFVQNLNDTLATRPIDIIPFIFPFLTRCPRLLGAVEGLSGWRAKWESMHDYIRAKIKQHEEHMRLVERAGFEATNLCDAFLLERDRQEAANPGQHSYTDWQLIRDFLELFLAGTETTATTLTWAALLLSLNPEVQRKAQREILDKIGRSRAPQMSDRPHLPFLCALMDEVLRYSSLVATNLLHRSLEDTQVLGHFIPKDAHVHTNLYQIHHDPVFWEKPNEFYPDHFLTAEGAYKPSKYLIPFSVGKRACLGESLARMEIFMGLATILQHFAVSLEDPGADIEAIIKGRTGALRCPLPHKVLFAKIADE